jgi:alpha-tubulin suppressor-like RCC1 family protein
MNDRDDVQAKSVFSGWNYSIVLTEMGQLFSFGWGMYGQVGSSSISPMRCCVRSGSAHGLVHFKSHDRVAGQLGQGDLTNEFLPRPIDFASETGDVGAGDYDDDDDEDIVDCACGLWHAVAITESGKVYTWGYGKDGQVNASAYRWCVLILM